MMTSSIDMDRPKTSPVVIRSAVVAALGGLLFGFDTAVISGATGRLEAVYSLSGAGLGLTVAMATIGTIIGAIVAGRLSDRFGRRAVLFWVGILFLAGALGTALCPTPELLSDGSAATQWQHLLFLVFRLIGGVGVGIASVVAPIYIAEIAPARVRGTLVGLVQFNIVFGILLAYISNYIILQIVSEEGAWRWMLGIMAVPSALFFVLVFTVPETPRWLMAAGREADARRVSRRLTASVEESNSQLQEMRTQLEEERRHGKVKFFQKKYTKPILLAFAIAAFNQLSGINAILYYAPKVMDLAGAGEVFGQFAPYLMSIGVGLMNLVATMLALTVIDRLGRRQLMIVGSIGYLVSLGFLAGMMFAYDSGRVSGPGVAWAVFIGLLVFIASHAFGQGSVIWVFISEIFPNAVRGRGQSWGSLTHWTFAFVTTYAFPALTEALGGGAAFLIFFLCMGGQLFWVLRIMPETKGVRLEDIEERLGMTDE